MITIRDYLVLKPIETIFRQFIDLNNIKENTLAWEQIEYIQNYLKNIWFKKYLNYYLRVSPEDFEDYLTTEIWDCVINIAMSYRQMQILVNQDEPLMTKGEDLGIINEIISDNTENFRGINTDLEYSKNNNLNTSKNFDPFYFMLNMNKLLKPISEKMSKNILKNLRLFYE